MQCGIPGTEQLLAKIRKERQMIMNAGAPIDSVDGRVLIDCQRRGVHMRSNI